MIFVIRPGMTDAEVVGHVMGTIRQPAHVIWCDACDSYQRVGHQCELTEDEQQEEQP